MIKTPENPGAAGSTHTVHYRKEHIPTSVLECRNSAPAYPDGAPREVYVPVELPTVDVQANQPKTVEQQLEEIQALQMQLHGRTWRVTT